MQGVVWKGKPHNYPDLYENFLSVEIFLEIEAVL